MNNRDREWLEADGLGGCPFQVWSLGELLRLERTLAAQRTRNYASEAA